VLFLSLFLHNSTGHFQRLETQLHAINIIIIFIKL